MLVWQSDDLFMDLPPFQGSGPGPLLTNCFFFGGTINVGSLLPFGMFHFFRRCIFSVDFDIYFAVSSDGGNTWTLPAPIDNGYKGWRRGGRCDVGCEHAPCLTTGLSTTSEMTPSLELPSLTRGFFRSRGSLPLTSMD